MDIVKNEVEVAQHSAPKGMSMTELASLQLALVGGGMGNEIFG